MEADKVTQAGKNMVQDSSDRLKSAYSNYINEELLLAVASNPTAAADCSKLRIRPVIIKGRTVYQVTRTVGPKELHTNIEAEEAVSLLTELTGSSFRQIELHRSDSVLTVLTGKKGTVTVKEHRQKREDKGPQAEIGPQAETDLQTETDKSRQTDKGRQAEIGPRTETGLQTDKETPAAGPVRRGPEWNCRTESLGQGGSNNRTKNYILPEGRPVPFLVELGVMTREGTVTAARYDKFRQINRYLEFVEDILPSLPSDREVSIIDFGCGKSYLTFALYYYLHELKGYNISITGLDLKEDVIAECSELARRFGYDRLRFLHGDIADYTGTDSVDMVVTLHACDTATDYALYKAISWGARVILCVPCCQHELNRQIKNEDLGQLLRYGLLRERMSALMTDGFRACMLEEQGYKTQVLEFIDMEHTPKNILIRAVKQPKKMGPGPLAQGKPYTELMKDLNADLTLYRLLHGDRNA